MFEDTKGIIIKSCDSTIQGSNNDIQNITQKTKFEQHERPLKTWVWTKVLWNGK